MDLQLQEQVAVVIGGASGIGLAIAKEFAREGCRVAIIDKSDQTETQARSLSEGIPLPLGEGGSRREPGEGLQTIGLRADVTDYAAMQEAARRIQDALSKPQHIVYAAGCGSGKFGFPFWNLQPADWDKVYRVNLLGAVHAAHAFAPTLVEQKRG